jgi:hypothetical protein
MTCVVPEDLSHPEEYLSPPQEDLSHPEEGRVIQRMKVIQRRMRVI